MDSLIKYIKQCKKRGKTDVWIKNQLRQAGHNENAINKAFAQTRSSSTLSMPLAFAIIGIALIGSVAGILAFYEPSGYAVKDDQQVLEEVKAAILQEEISKINEMDLTLVEKEQRIMELTMRLNDLFAQIQFEREQNLDDSIELINNILDR